MHSHHIAIFVLVLSACTPDTTTPQSGSETSSSTTDVSTDGVSQTSNTPTTGGTTDVSTGNSSSSSDLTNFITPPDGGTCLRQDGELRCLPPCDPLEQDCSEGQKCIPWSNNPEGTYDDVRCVPLTEDPKEAGEACEFIEAGKLENCNETTFCWQNVCTPFCRGASNDPECPEASHCVAMSGGHLPLCLPACDPLLQNCAEGQLCSPHGGPSPEEFICAPDNSGDEGQAFDPCLQINACDPGLVCIDPSVATECDPEVSGCCVPFCDRTQPNTCPGEGQTCQPWFDEPVIGVCALPE